VEVALLDWGGEGPLALLHHANGFSKGLWGLVAQGLMGRYRVIAMDARGHGDSSHPEGPEAYAWHHFAEDAAAVADHLAAAHGRLALGVGHSFGGTSMLGAAARRPELFERLVLVDPVVPPPEQMPPERTEHVAALVERARRRRSHWSSRQEARRWFAERSLFEAWRPEALDLYVQDGLRERSDGSVALKCPGAVEAAVFAGSRGFDVFGLARGVTVPCLWLRASRGDFPRAVYEALAGSMLDARVQEVDSGHLVPMEHPDLLVEAVAAFSARPLPRRGAAGDAVGAGGS